MFFIDQGSIQPVCCYRFICKDRVIPIYLLGCVFSDLLWGKLIVWLLIQCLYLCANAMYSILSTFLFLIVQPVAARSLHADGIISMVSVYNILHFLRLNFCIRYIMYYIIFPVVSSVYYLVLYCNCKTLCLRKNAYFLKPPLCHFRKKLSLMICFLVQFDWCGVHPEYLYEDRLVSVCFYYCSMYCTIYF